MRPSNFNAEELCEALQGTCTQISEHLPEGMEEDDLTADDHQVIDNRIFLCAQCGWWCEECEEHEEDGEQICDDCFESTK
jgi:hypothetical protein